MTTTGNIILNHTQISQKIRRIAFQIYETNSSEKEVILAGIVGNGYLFAEKLVDALEEISSLNVTICKVNIDKKKPLNPIKTSLKEMTKEVSEMRRSVVRLKNETGRYSEKYYHQSKSKSGN